MTKHFRSFHNADFDTCESTAENVGYILGFVTDLVERGAAEDIELNQNGVTGFAILMDVLSDTLLDAADRRSEENSKNFNDGFECGKREGLLASRETAERERAELAAQRPARTARKAAL